MADLQSIGLSYGAANQALDPEWYGQTYRDVGLLGMDAAYHYEAYGRLLGRYPNAGAASRASGSDPLSARIAELRPPAKGSELHAAEEIASSEGYAVALKFAETHLPADRTNTLSALRANAALARGDRSEWLKHLNSYLSAYGTPPLKLREGGQLLDQLSSMALPDINGGPLITVIMPAWNAEATIVAAASSILDQTWKNLELFIIDDCSSDGTWKLMMDLAARDSRVRLLRNRRNVGPYVSKNIALTYARGEWVTGHDADDWSQPARLADHLRAAVNAGAEASLSYMLRIQPDGRISKIGALSEFSPDGVLRVASISCLFKRDVLSSRIGFWDSVKFGADSEMIARTRKAVGDRFHTFPNVGMLCLDDATSLTNHPVHGIRASGGKLSLVRASYKRCWEEWLSGVEDASLLYLPFPQSTRRYRGDFNHNVDVCSVSNICGGLDG